uniref:FoP_duplication domain-containing protein n=1 Tax=Panagrellus redivivus TaxID=6233 RepID=A0A7E4VI68_PANRE
MPTVTQATAIVVIPSETTVAPTIVSRIAAVPNVLNKKIGQPSTSAVAVANNVKSNAVPTPTPIAVVPRLQRRFTKKYATVTLSPKNRRPNKKVEVKPTAEDLDRELEAYMKRPGSA